MHVLVTGATGLLGSVLTRQLVDDGATVRIFRRATSSLEALGDYSAQVEHATGDLRDVYAVQEAMHGITHVYHTAAVVPSGTLREETLHAVNVQGTAHVVDTARVAGVQRLVYTSSIAALGRHGDQTVSEETVAAHAALSGYGQSKRAAEREVHRGIAEGLDAVIVNPSLMFGLGRPHENTRRIVELARRGWLRVVPPGGTGVVDARDVAAGHRRAMRHGATGTRYILSSENLSWHAIGRTLNAAFGQAPPRYTLPAAALHLTGRTAGLLARVGLPTSALRDQARAATRRTRYSNRRAIEELGCSFRPFADTAAFLANALPSDT